MRVARAVALQAGPWMAAWAMSCGGALPSVRVPEDVAESLPRESRVLLRDAEQEIVIAQAAVEDARQAVTRRQTELDAARARGYDGDEDLREAEIELAEARLAVADADVDLAERRLERASKRRDQTHAEVLFGHGLISAGTAHLKERRQLLEDINGDLDADVAEGRKLREEMETVAQRRDKLLDRHLAKTAQKSGFPWVE